MTSLFNVEQASRLLFAYRIDTLRFFQSSCLAAALLCPPKLYAKDGAKADGKSSPHL